jgi:hypothetical protein
MTATGLSMEMRIAHASIMHFDIYQGSTLGNRDRGFDTLLSPRVCELDLDRSLGRDHDCF